MKSKLYARLILVAFLILLNTLTVNSQTSGCPDPFANNYNPAVTINNGSCTYNKTFYKPPIKVDPISKILIESSGLQMAGNFLWSFNDGGGAAAIYRIDTVTNALLQTVNLIGATNVDWEDIAFDGTFFYVGDIGNNTNGARTDLKIYKFPLNAIPNYKTNPVANIAIRNIGVISFKYKNQLKPVSTGLNNTKFDCEAMVIDKGKIHLFTKNWINLNTTHYVINSTSPGNYIADSIETLQTNYLVTAADKAPSQDLIVLLGYQATGRGHHFMHILSDYSSSNYFNGNVRKINLPDALLMGQGEGIAFRNNSYGYISNERLSKGPFSINQKLRSFDISHFVNVSSGIGLFVKFTSLKAAQRKKSVQIIWNVKSKPGIQYFELEKSNDGKHFLIAEKMPLTKSSAISYSWVDIKPYKGNNFYRIKCVQKKGNVTYSAIVKLVLRATEAA